MRHRLISYPSFFEEEARLINALFELGLPCLHLRKPKASRVDCMGLLEQINALYYNKIISHQYPELVTKYDLKGYHLREPERLQLSKGNLIKTIANYHQNNQIIGTAIHAKATIDDLNTALDYAFLSPVFPSISKPNYQPKENLTIIQKDLTISMIALGGIGLDTLDLVKGKGFKEVAFLGAVWGDKTKVLSNYKLLCKKMKTIDLMS